MITYVARYLVLGMNQSSLNRAYSQPIGGKFQTTIILLPAFELSDLVWRTNSSRAFQAPSRFLDTMEEK
ncbi:hypothetical protein CEXT_567201 [Caerostris extrusa]|uniref:Uncharacterized protein n=1 Tax=Caerostris extrusa TaxID=172846 RepID=A0AAV4QBD8_CAEEX|nr:hypothetical protein CEXT_567201 [Caerostris extrusa]